MIRLAGPALALSVAVAILAPGVAAACMKNSVSAQSTPAIVADGGAATTIPTKPLPAGKTGG